MTYELVLLAAGLGKRMNNSRNKVLLELLDKPVIIYGLEIFLKDSNCQLLILVVKSDEVFLFEEAIAHYIPNDCSRIKIVVGGLERQDSVFQGLLEVQNKKGYVLVHDGARPFLSSEVLDQVAKEVLRTEAAIVGVPVKDTIKKVAGGKVIETIPRETLWQIQTPQAFRCDELLAAHEKAQKAGFLGTDDASLMEKFSLREIVIVKGQYENIKLTTPGDMILGEAILKSRLL